jgi:hypothetical protein
MPPRRVAAIPSSGDGHANLAPQVDQFVKDLMKQKNLPGMSVAITQGGRLILAKGYGYANVQTKALLKENARLRIGSVTKAVVTGPAGFQLMKAKGINPATTTLYGTNGLFGTTYDSDIEIGVKRYTPIVALAIGPQDHVYAWYSNGTFSSGTTSDLDKYSTPKSYSLAPGKKPVDIRGIAIANTQPEIAAFVYYDDGTRSSGPPEDLDRYGVSQNSVALPRGKSMLHVVGIAMAKSNNHVYVWYEDGTVSAGSTTNFESYSKPKPFTVPHQASPFMGFTPYTIRGVSIASNDHVYTWFSNGQVSSGRSTKLDHYKSPYAYTMPLRRTGGPDDWEQWYRKITVQNLLDHRAGFTRSGDEDGASAMFLASPNHPLTYHMVHRHFLRTRKLLYEPDTAGAYSNHGFGLWTLLIEQMSGKSYRSALERARAGMEFPRSASACGRRAST